MTPDEQDEPDMPQTLQRPAEYRPRIVPQTAKKQRKSKKMAGLRDMQTARAQPPPSHRTRKIAQKSPERPAKVRVRRLVPKSEAVVLRPYQVAASDELFSMLTSGTKPRVMYQLPPGAGKTEIAADVVRKALILNKGSYAVWMTHRKELRRQTAARMSEAGIETVDLVKVPPAKRRFRPGALHIISDAAFMPPTEDRNAILVIDEAHHSVADTWAERIANWPGPVLGLTATPCRLNPKEGFDHLYSDLLVGPQPRELVTQRALCEVVTEEPSADCRISGAGSLAGDYSMSDTAAKWAATFASDKPVRAYMESSADKSARAVWYVPTIDSGTSLLAQLRLAGLTAEFVSARTPQSERDAALSRFDEGESMHLVNVNIVTEGFDCPSVGCVMIYRPTKSESLYLQMAGRAARTAEGKTIAVVVDAVQGWKLHGGPMDDRQWSLAPSSRSGEAPWTVPCPVCRAIVPPADPLCRGCGTAMTRPCPSCRTDRHEGCWSEGSAVCDYCTSARLPFGIRMPPWMVSSDGSRYVDLGARGRFVISESKRGHSLLWYSRSVSRNPKFDTHEARRFNDLATSHAAENLAASLVRGEVVAHESNDYSLTVRGLVVSDVPQAFVSSSGGV